MYSLNIATIAKQIQDLFKKNISVESKIAALQTFSSTDPIDTGMKWIDGKDIKRLVVTGTSPSSDQLNTSLNYDTITNLYGFYVTAGGSTALISRAVALQGVNGTTITLPASTSTSYQGVPFYYVVEYTEPDPSGLLSPNPDDERSIETPDEKLNIEETPDEEVQEVKKTTRKKS